MTSKVKPFVPNGFVSTSDQIAAIEETLQLARKRPVTPESEIALRSVLLVQGFAIAGLIDMANAQRGPTQAAARGQLKEIYQDLLQAKVRVIAETAAAEEQAVMKGRFYWAISRWRRTVRWVKGLRDR